jgi:hypothetical protein
METPTCLSKMDSAPINRTKAPMVGDLGTLQGWLGEARDICSATSWLVTKTMG